MDTTTQAILELADKVHPGGRKLFLAEIAPLVSDKIFLSAESVAKRLDVSVSCIRHWKEIGRLVPTIKIPGGTARYTLEDIENFVNTYKKGKHS